MQKQFENCYILRTPQFKIDRLVTTEEELIKEFQNPLVREALYAASIDLFNELISLEKGENRLPAKREKIIIGLYKYFTRMCSRPTPFGTFAGISTGHFGEKNDVVISEKCKAHVRLDMDYLCNLYYELNKDASLYPFLKFYSNNTLYRIGSQWRYVEYQFKKGNERFHNLVSIENNIVIEKLIQFAKNGSTYQELIRNVLEFGFSEEEASSYIQELIQSQILYSSLYPSVSGEEYQIRLFRELEGIPNGRFKEITTIVDRILNSKTSLESKLTLVQELFLSLGFKLTSRHLLQIDLFRHPERDILDQKILGQVEDASQILLKLLMPPMNTTNLERFKVAYYERYEEKFLPLAMVMDTDVGIGYKYAVTIANIGNKMGASSPNEKAIRSLKLNLYTKAIQQNLMSVELKSEDVQKINIDNSINFGDSHNFIGSVLLNENQEVWLRYKFRGGSSALNLLGRFGHLSDEIKELCINIATHEAKNNGNIIMAEVVHLPHGRLGNVVTRPHYRNYEIPYLSLSSLPQSHQLPIDDLYVGVVNFRVVLFSKSLNREIIPRMANAHNFENDSLPLYNFLCDLQRQNIRQGLYWSWDEFYEAEFLPRVTFKNVILDNARWNIPTDRFQKLDFETNEVLFYQIVEELGLPNHIIIPQGDNELYINLKSKMGAVTFLKTAKKNSRLVIEEFIYENLGGLNGYSNEIIIPYVDVKDTQGVRGIKCNLSDSKDQVFSPFSEWMFFKIYTGRTHMEKLLIETIPLLIAELNNGNVISKWFFIRYADPKSHLRLRFLLTEDSKKQDLLSILAKYFQDQITDSRIWDIQIATYNREVERYGRQTIQISEAIFFHNSEMVLMILPTFKLLPPRDQLLYTIFCVHELLTSFGLELQQRISLIAFQSDLFVKEFQVKQNKNLRQILNNEFRESRYLIQQILDGERFSQDNVLDFIGKICKRQNKLLEPLVEGLKTVYHHEEDKLSNIIASFIHMFINRLFKDNPRYKEMNVYYFLDKILYSELAKTKSSGKAPQIENI